jgi:hypothetical protein
MDKMERVISGGHRDKDGKLHPPVTRSSALRDRIKNRKSKLREAIKPKSSADEGEYGYEGDMAMSQLRSIIRNCEQMLDALDEKTDLPEWVQSKITLAKDYIETSANYLLSELEESVDRRDMSAEGQTRRQFIQNRIDRAVKRKELGEPRLTEETKAQRAATKFLNKKRKLVDFKPTTNTNSMYGPVTQAPTSDASAPSPGENR